jgi:hypothetical protein
MAHPAGGQFVPPAGRIRRKLVVTSMRHLLRVFIVLTALTSATLDAQTAQPAPSVPPPIVLPFPPLMQPPTGGLNPGSVFQPPAPLGGQTDLFRVGPRDRVYTTHRVPFGRTYNGGVGYSIAPPSQTAPTPAESVDVPIATPIAPSVQPAPALPPVPVAAPPASSSDRMYVIPQCYMGNVRPRADQLRPGCSLDDLRILRTK